MSWKAAKKTSVSLGNLYVGNGSWDKDFSKDFQSKTGAIIYSLHLVSYINRLIIGANFY